MLDCGRPLPLLLLLLLLFHGIILICGGGGLEELTRGVLERGVNETRLRDMKESLRRSEQERTVRWSRLLAHEQGKDARKVVLGELPDGLEALLGVVPLLGRGSLGLERGHGTTDQVLKTVGNCRTKLGLLEKGGSNQLC